MGQNKVIRKSLLHTPQRRSLSHLTPHRAHVSVGMGRSCFVIDVTTKEAFEIAKKDVVVHNASPERPLGGQFTDEEFRLLDPHRADIMLALEHAVDEPPIMSCKDRWTRGEDFYAYCLVKYDGKLWLEATNGGGGAATMAFLVARNAEPGRGDTLWFKPQMTFPDRGAAYNAAPALAQVKNVGQLSSAYATAST